MMMTPKKTTNRNALRKYAKQWLTSVLLMLGLASASYAACDGADSRFVDHANGTVSDQQTGLMWARCAVGLTGQACSGMPTSFTWFDALGAAPTSSLAAHTDWRVPNSKELFSLIETSCENPAVNKRYFPITLQASSSLPAGFWSSTPNANNPTLAAGVDFNSGAGATGGMRSLGFQVRLVRGGQ